MRYLLSSSTRRRWGHALVLLGVIAAAVGAFSGSASARLPAEGPEGLPEDYAPEPFADPFFVGEPARHIGCHFGVPLSYTDLVMMSDVWYANKDGKKLTPRVGEVWYGVAHVGLANPCNGRLAVDFVVKPPPNTTFAISQTNEIKCSMIREGEATWIDITQDRSVCPTGVIPTANGWWLGRRNVASNTHFAIQFPLRSSAPLRGAAAPNGGDRLSVEVTSDNSSPAEPFVHVNVEQPPRLTAISCDGTPGILCGVAAE
jgi:hypothetical protein